MTVIIGVFDDSAAMERAILQLNEQGFDEQVYDVSIVAQEQGTHLGPGLYPAPGAPGSDKSFPEFAGTEAVSAFRAHLSELHVAPADIDSYVNNFRHGGHFVVVKTEKARGQQASDILSSNRATQVHRHH